MTDLERQREKHKLYMREWLVSRPGYGSASSAAWAKANPEKSAASKMKWRAANLEKRRAHNRLFKALKHGRIVRPDACEGCGKTCRPHGHHEDYSQPLVVQWLCPQCHANAHRLARREAAA